MHFTIKRLRKPSCLWTSPWKGFLSHLTLPSIPSTLQKRPNPEQHQNGPSQQWTSAEPHSAAWALQHWQINQVKSSWFRISAEVFQKWSTIWGSSTSKWKVLKMGNHKKKGKLCSWIILRNHLPHAYVHRFWYQGWYEYKSEEFHL